MTKGCESVKRQYTDREIQQLLKTMVIVADTREQVWGHIESGLKGMRYAVERAKLDFGDYTCKLPDVDGCPMVLSDEIVIERKANLDEIAMNLTADRKRFEAEFLRAKANGVKVHLLIENASWQDIATGNYRSQFSPKCFKASLLSWQARFNLTVAFCRMEDSAEYIAGTLYYWLKNRLEKGGAL